MMTNYSEFPENPANLYINDHIITRKIKNEMRIASRSPDLREYTMKKYGRTSSIYQTSYGGQSTALL